MTEMMKIWLKDLYLVSADDHLSVAKHEHLCALGSPDGETAAIHEASADEHRAFANILMSMSENIDNMED